MLARATKSGKTMYVTEFEGVEHASMDVEAIRLLENGEVNKLFFSPKDNITFVNVKGKAKGGSAFGNGAKNPEGKDQSVPKMSRGEAFEIAKRMKADAELLVSGLS